MSAPTSTGPPSTGPATTGAEREDLRATVRAFVRDRAPLAEVRRWSGTGAGYDPGMWADLLPRLATGELLAAVAVSGPAGRADGTPGVTASRSPGGAVLDGEALYVVDGHVAGVLLVAARDEGAHACRAAAAPGLPGRR